MCTPVARIRPIQATWTGFPWVRQEYTLDSIHFMMRREGGQSDALLGLTTYDSGRGMVWFKLDRKVRKGDIFLTGTFSEQTWERELDTQNNKLLGPPYSSLEIPDPQLQAQTLLRYLDWSCSPLERFKLSLFSGDSALRQPCKDCILTWLLSSIAHNSA